MKIGDTSSQLYNTNLGTPQGSVLGPLLFLLYVNDLPEFVTDHGRLFMNADDTTVVLSAPTVKEVSEKVSLVLDLFNTWCESYHLIINANKSVIVKFCYGHRITPDLSFHINDFEISLSENTNFLGTIVDQRLDFTAQVNNVCSKLCKAMYAIRTLKNTITDDSLLNVYYAQVY